jgi:DNA-binding response OmpR family regulator
MNFWWTPSHAASSFTSRRSNEEGDSRSNANNVQHPLAGSRVLVVEDEFIIALELQSNFEDAGAEVVGPAHTLAEALELATHADITAATLDLQLMRDSVAPVARALAKRGIPFVFYSGQPSTDPVIAEWPRCKALAKPAHPEELVEAVAQLVTPRH